jgi:hypothetical protein
MGILGFGKNFLQQICGAPIGLIRLYEQAKGKAGQGQVPTVLEECFQTPIEEPFMLS